MKPSKNPLGICLLVSLLALPLSAFADEDPHARHRAMMKQKSDPVAESADVDLRDRQLVDQHGREVMFVSDVIGDKKAVIAGIYTGCTTICPITTLLFAGLQDALGERMEREVRLISLSVDPANDTPAMLAEAAADIDAKPGWIWLTGAPVLQNEVLLGIGAYSTDVTEHPPVFLVGDGRTGEFVQLYGFPSVEEFLGLLGPEGGSS